MALSAFDDKSKVPAAKDLKRVLGRTGAHWDGLVAQIASDHAPLVEQWDFSGAQWGWSLRLKSKKRTILYMTPCKGYFLAGLVLGDKAVQAAHDSDLRNSLLAVIDGARKYAEGRGVRIEVRTRKDRDSVMKLAAIKMAS